VESELGKGSCFTIHVPLSLRIALKEAATESEPDATPADAADGNTILIIDSDPSVTTLLRQVLSREGYRAVTAGSAEEGLALALAARPSAILLGALIPEADGWLVLQRLKSNGMLRTCPVILLTAQQDAAKGRAFGASGHLIKPVDRDQLLRALKSVRAGPEVEDEDVSNAFLDRAAS